MKRRGEKLKRKMIGGFKCLNCGQWVGVSAPGTRHRNHCPLCLWSKHLDRSPGDRQAACGGGMEPIGLTFKAAGEGREGEIMVVHRCRKCGTVRKNRIAGDDRELTILEVFRHSLGVPISTETIVSLKDADIRLLEETDEREVLIQLYGKPNLPERYH